MDTTQQHTLATIAALHAEQRPDHVAIHCEGRRTTYATLHRESNRAAHALCAQGVVRGSRVAYLGRESEHYYTIALACAKSESVLVPVNWRLTAGEVDHILRDSGADILFVEDEFLATAERVAADLDSLRTLVRLDAGDGPGAGFVKWKDGYPDRDLAPRGDRDTPRHPALHQRHHWPPQRGRPGAPHLPGVHRGDAAPRRELDRLAPRRRQPHLLPRFPHRGHGLVHAQLHRRCHQRHHAHLRQRGGGAADRGTGRHHHLRRPPRCCR
ncbi:hypothetical protein GCM10020000_70830 [Streptomyces olivoverticillatus]